MKNILFVYSSLKDRDSTTSEVIKQLQEYTASLRLNNVSVEVHDLGLIYQEDPIDITERVTKAFRALDKKNLPIDSLYQEKLLILARYTKRLSRDLMRANHTLMHRQDTLKIFVRNLRNHPVVPYNENIHRVTTESNPIKLFESYKEELRTLGLELDSRKHVNDLTYQDIPYSQIIELYTGSLAFQLAKFEDFVHLYIANKYINEYLNSDTVYMAAPIYNHNIPSRLQNYLNYWVRSGVTFNPYNPKHIEHEFFNKDFNVISACGASKEEYSDYVGMFFKRFTSTIGVKDVKIHVLGDRNESSRLYDREIKELVDQLSHNIRRSVAASRDGIYNVARYRHLPNISGYPRLEDFYIYYESKAPADRLDQAIKTREFNLVDFASPYFVESSIVDESSSAVDSEGNKRSFVSVAFTNFVFSR